MKKYFAWFCFVLIMMFNTVYGQKQTTHEEQIWAGYVNQTRFSDHWGMWLDLHLRTREDFVKGLSTGIIRGGVTYHANDKLKFTAGYAYVNFFPEDDSGVSQPEHRPWQQVYWQTTNKKSKLVNAIRLEERFRRKMKSSEELGEGYDFNYRIRYNTMLFIPLGKKAFGPNTLSISLNDEIMVNFGKEIVYNYFDQNRLLIGFAYHVNSSDYLQFGYMNLFQQMPAGNVYRDFHVARVYFYHNLDLRKSKKN